MNDIYAKECIIECVDNGKTMEADIENFHKGKFLSVYVNTVRVNLQYDTRTNVYVGSMAELEFISEGPKLLGRHR
jgi:hypothetical protein